MRITKRTKGPSSTPKSPKISLVALLVLIVFIAIVLLFSGCSKEEVLELDINEYLRPELTGYNGYGSIAFDLDYEAMFRDLPVANNTKAKSEEVARTLGLFVAEYEKSNTLKNGDSVSIRWKVNNTVLKNLEQTLDVKFLYDDFAYAVGEFEDVKEYDPFVDLYFNTNRSASGCGTVEFFIRHKVDGQDIVLNVAHDGENGKLKNGDVLNLTIKDSIDADEFTRNTGLRITKTADKFKVDCLGSYATDDTIFMHIGDNDELIFNQVVNDWVISGLNDENIDSVNRVCIPDCYLFYTNAEQVENAEPTDSMLIAIYYVNDAWVEGGYYTFLGLKGIFSFDSNGVYINHGETLPTSFIYYEKELVRYNEKHGWVQGGEELGFLYDNVAYAGHRDIQEILDYLEKTYGKDYEHHFISGWGEEDVVLDRIAQE